MELLVLFSLFAMAVAENIRVEFRLTNYTNPGGVLADGRTKCERSAPCDPKLVGEVDTTSTALNSFPDAKARAKWVTIFQKRATDKDNVGKIVSRDICGGSFKKSNLRVQASDVNTYNSNREIQQWECMTSSNPRDVATREGTAMWSNSKPCDAKYTRLGNAKLMYQWRAYAVPSSTCGRTTN